MKTEVETGVMPGKPRSQGVTGHWKRQGRRPAERPWEEHGAANAFILGSYTLGDSIPAVLNPLGLWYLAVAATEDERNQAMRACCVPGTLPDVFTSVFPCQPKSSQTRQFIVTVPILQGHTARKRQIQVPAQVSLDPHLATRLSTCHRAARPAVS